MSKTDSWKDQMFSSSDPTLFEINRLIDRLIANGALQKIGRKQAFFKAFALVYDEFKNWGDNQKEIQKTKDRQRWRFTIPSVMERMAERGNPRAKEFLERANFQEQPGLYTFEDYRNRIPHPNNEINKANYRKAFQWLEEVGSRGDAQAQYVLSELYLEYEYGIDYARSVYWATKAARQGHWGALSCLAYLLMSATMGFWFFGGKCEAENLYLILANAGVASAQENLVCMYERQHRHAQAIHWQEILVDSNPNEWEYMNALKYLYRDTGKIDCYLKTLHRMINELNSTGAMVELGEVYLEGKYVNQDYELGRYWLEMAATKDQINHACERLAQMYFEGEGVEKDAKKAIDWLIQGIGKHNFGLLRRVAKLQKENLLTDQQKERFKEIYEKLFKEHRRTCHDFWDWKEEDYMNWMKRANGIL